MRKLIVPAVFALAVAACGGGTEPVAATSPPIQPEPAESVPPSASETTSPEISEAPSGNDTAPSETTEASAPSFDGPPAPEFELVLSDGSTFRLSDEEKPVYMVFWAEW